MKSIYSTEMEKLKEILLKEEGIPIPEEFSGIIKPGSRITMRIERFGMIIQPKIDPVKDLIGSVHLKKSVNVEKHLDERFEYDKEIY